MEGHDSEPKLCYTVDQLNLMLDTVRQQAREKALEEAAKSICSHCENNLPVVAKHPNDHFIHEAIGQDDFLYCYAWAIRALAAKTEEK